MSDPEVNMMGGEGQAYTPSAYEDEYGTGEGWAEAAKEGQTTAADPAASSEETVKAGKEIPQ